MNHRQFSIATCLALALAACDPASSGDDYEGDESGECSDGADNDRDGAFDCNDPGCEGSPDCAEGDTDTDTDADADTDTDADADADADTDADTDAPTLVDNRDLPVISLTEPVATATLTTTEASLDFEGRAGEGVVQIRWRSSNGDRGTASGTTEWATTIDLDEGPQDLLFEAEDGDGQVGSLTLRVLSWSDTAFADTPRLDPWTVLLGEDTEVQVSIAAATTGRISAGEAVLDCGGAETRATLSFEGQEAAGETWAGTLAAPGEVGECLVTAELTVDGDARTSAPSLLRVREPLTEARAQELVDLMDEVAAVLSDTEPMVEENLEAAFAILAARSDLASVERTVDGLDWITDEGLPFAAGYHSEGTRGGSAAPATPGGRRGRGARPLGTMPASKLYGFSPFSDDFSPYDEVKDWLPTAVGDVEGCEALDTEFLDRSDVRVSTLVSPDGGVYHLSTHGGLYFSGVCTSTSPVPTGQQACPAGWSGGAGQYQVMTLSREGFTAASLQAYQHELQAWEIVPIAFFLDDAADAPHAIGSFVNVLAVSPAYFSNELSPGQLEGSVVAFSSCYSGRDSRLPAVLLGKGAQAFFGFTEPVGSGHAMAFFQALYDAWWFQGQTLDQAFLTAYGAAGPPMGDESDTVWYTNASVPPFRNMVINGTFEADMAGWTGEYNVSVCSDVEGDYEPLDSDQMAEIHIGRDPTLAYYSTLEQDLQIAGLEAGTSYTLQFYWRIVTSQHNYQVCSTAGTPWVVARMDGAPSGNLILWERDPPDICGSLTDDDTGWYSTPWTISTVGFTLPEDIPSPTLNFTVGSDNLYEHYLLLDDIELFVCD